MAFHPDIITEGADLLVMIVHGAILVTPGIALCVMWPAAYSMAKHPARLATSSDNKVSNSMEVHRILRASYRTDGPMMLWYT